MSANNQIINCLMNDIQKYRHEGANGDKHKCMTRTIKDFTFMKGAVKIELCATSLTEVIVTRISGDIDGVFGLEKGDLIGRNILKIGRMSRNYVLRVFKELEKTGFAFKELQFNGKKIQSILMLREGNNLVEIAWVKEVIK